MDYYTDDVYDNDYGSNDDYEYDDQQGVLEECKEAFAKKDMIMEPGIHDYIRRFLDAGGLPKEYIELLSDNYVGVAQAANLMADWLIVAGMDVSKVQDMVELHLKDMLLKHFNPKKADSIFATAGEMPYWIESMIEHACWRTMFYELAEKYPDCLMLHFTIKIISDAGYQGEIGATSTACNQIEVFSRVLKTFVIKYLEQKQEGNQAVVELTKAICRGQHTYLFSQSVLHHLMINWPQAPQIRRLVQELQKGATESGHDVHHITFALNGCYAAYPRLFSALNSMLSRGALNPGDISVIQKLYTSQDPPPVEYIRIPQFLELLISLLFKPGGHINADHRSKYIFLLGYAVAVYENWNEGRRTLVIKDELKATVQAIERVHAVCSRDLGGTLQLTTEVGMLYQCIRYPVVSIGILKWVEDSLSEKNYVEVMTESTPLQVVLLDEVSTCHPLQHPLVLQLLIKLFQANYTALETLMELEFKKTILDRMVHMLSRGYVVPVVRYIKSCMDNQATDISLMRHFVTEVLEMIAPPYSPQFVEIFLPIVRNEAITGILRSQDGKDDVSLFLKHCDKR